MSNIQTVITITHGKEVIQTIKNKLLHPASKPKEQARSMMNFFNALVGGDRDAKVVAQVNSGNAVIASATLTVSSGASGDTAVVSGTTFTCVDHRETTNVTFAADSSGNLNSTFFTFQDVNGANKYYVWFNINSAGVDPKPTGYNGGGIKVSGATNASAATLATAAIAACASVVGVGVTAGASGHAIFTTLLAGVATKVTDGSAATSFTFTRSITGSALTALQYNVATTDTLTAVNLAAVINAHSAMGQVATATSAAAVVTVSSWFPGPVGNYITLTASAGNTASAATLAGGAIATTYSTQNTYHLGV